MNRICIIITLCLGMVLSAGAQETYNSSGARRTIVKKKTQPKGFNPERLIFGGGLGLSFGNVTAISVAPMVGYRITDKLAAGVGLGYLYVNFKDDVYIGGNTYDTKYSVLTPSVWARYLVFNNFFAHTEYEQNFMSFTDYRYDQSGSGNIESYKQKLNSPALLLGAGYRQPVSDNASFVILALYDVIQDEYSPYRDRVDIRFGLNIGF